MVQNAAEGKEDVRSVNAEQGCSHTELRIVGNNIKLVYITFWITAHSSTNSRSYTSTPGVSRNLSKAQFIRSRVPEITLPLSYPGRGNF